MLNENPDALFKTWLHEYGGTVLKVARAYTLTARNARTWCRKSCSSSGAPCRSLRGGPARPPGFIAWRSTRAGWHRKEGRRRARQLPLLEPEDLPAAGMDSAEQLHQREVVERLYAAIRQLPKADTALVLLYLEDLSYCQIAEVLGITESNVGVKLSRARKALGELMKEIVYES